MGNQQAPSTGSKSGSLTLAQQLQQAKLKKRRKVKKRQIYICGRIWPRGFGQYFGHGQVVESPANPMVSAEFDYPHRDKHCFYRY